MLFRSLYSHQAEAMTQIAAGNNVVIVTPTASGKTLCYNLPVLNAIINDPSARALYLFPTKALAEDQLHEFKAGWMPRAPISKSSPTTATRRRTRGGRSGRGRTSS